MSNFPQGTLPRLIQVALAEVGTAETGNNETKSSAEGKLAKLGLSADEIAALLG